MNLATTYMGMPLSNPLIVGYGFGMRTMLFGYFAKVDYGWNWETKTNRKPLLHFSIGADF